MRHRRPWRVRSGKRDFADLVERPSAKDRKLSGAAGCKRTSNPRLRPSRRRLQPTATPLSRIGFDLSRADRTAQAQHNWEKPPHQLGSRGFGALATVDEK